MKINNTSNSKNNNDIINILEKLKASSDIDSRSEALKDLWNFYDHHNLLYNPIVKFIYDNENNEKSDPEIGPFIGLLRSSIDNYYNNHNKCCPSTYKKLNNLIDYMMAANVQVTGIKNLNHKAIEQSKDLLSKMTDKLSNIKDSMYTDFVAILGIFATIIFALFGGYGEISSSIKNLGSGTKFNGVLKISTFLSIILLIFIYLMFQEIKGIILLKSKSNKNCSIFINCIFIILLVVLIFIFFHLK